MKENPGAKPQVAIDTNTAAPDFSVAETAPKPKLLSANFITMVAAGAIAIGVGGYFYFRPKQKSTKSDGFPFQQQQQTQQGNIPTPVISQSNSPDQYGAVNDALLQDAEAQRASRHSAQFESSSPSPSTSPPSTPQLSNASSPPTPPAPASAPPINKPTPPPALSVGQQALNAQQEKDNKIKASIMLISDSGSASTGTNTNQDTSTNYTATATTARSVRVTKTADMARLVAQGKIMESVLETPIDTAFPGPVRATITRDVYSEKGENILIPKGSRVIGTVEGGYSPGQDRVFVKWNRIILPSGHDIMVQDAPIADKLGGIGVAGDVHRGFLSVIGNSLLLSAINVTFAEVLQKAFNIGSPTTTTSASSTVTTASPTQQAAQSAITDLQSTTTQWIKDNYFFKPSITIEQGTIVKIFVNQDIIFSGKIVGGVNIIQ